MKRTLSILSVLVLMVSLFSVAAFSSAAATVTDGGKTYTLGGSFLGADVSKFGDELAAGTVTGDMATGYTLQTSGWKAIVSYYDTAAIDLSGTTYLYYDFTIGAGGEGLIRLNGWDASASQLIGAKHGAKMGGDDGDMLPAGTYKGVVNIDSLLTTLPEETYAVLGIVKGPVTYRALNVATLTSGEAGEEPVEEPAEEPVEEPADTTPEIPGERLTIGGTTYIYDNAGSLLGSDVSKFGDELPTGTVTGDMATGYTLQNNGWKAIISYYDASKIDLSGTTYLYYDFTIGEGAECLIRMNGWDASASELIGAKHGAKMGGDDGDMLPAGTYKGIVNINDVLTALPEETYAILGVVNGPVTFRALDVLNVVATTGADGDSVPTGDATPYAVAAAAVLSAAALVFVSRKNK